MTFSRLPAIATVDDLSAQQAAFVRAYVELGGHLDSAAEAALSAGYGGGVRENAIRRARELLKNPRILSAIRAEMTNAFTAAAVLGLSTLKELCTDGPPSVRLSAARELLDRGYGPVQSRSTVVHEGKSIVELLIELDAAEAQSPHFNTRKLEGSPRNSL